MPDAITLYAAATLSPFLRFLCFRCFRHLLRYAPIFSLFFAMPVTPDGAAHAYAMMIFRHFFASLRFSFLMPLRHCHYFLSAQAHAA